jgi:hypothetical protein
MARALCAKGDDAWHPCPQPQSNESCDAETDATGDAGCSAAVAEAVPEAMISAQDIPLAPLPRSESISGSYPAHPRHQTVTRATMTRVIRVGRDGGPDMRGKVSAKRVEGRGFNGKGFVIRAAGRLF